MEQSLIKLEEATRILAEYQEVEDILPHYNLAEQYQYYAKKQKLGHEAVNYGAEIKLRAARRMGEVLEPTINHNGGRPQKNGTIEEPFFDEVSPTLSDIGLTKKQSSQFQQIAAIPQDIFEGHLAELKAKEQEITTAGLLRVAKSLYFVGYWLHPQLGFERWILLDWPAVQRATAKNLIPWQDRTNQNGHAQASFKFVEVKNIPDNCILAKGGSRLNWYTPGTIMETPHGNNSAA